MSSPILLLALALAAQAAFTSFSFCRDGLGGVDELQCVELDPAGRGSFTATPQDAETVEVPIELSSSGRDRFVALLSQTSYLDEADDYDSGREVPSVGLKTLVLDGAQGRREARFYLSTRREVMELASFFDRLITQEILVMDIETTLQFDPLGIPKRLDQIQQDLDRDRIADAHRLIPVLERLAADSRVVGYARRAAEGLIQQIELRD